MKTILYLNTDPGARIPEMTLAGIRRYAAARRWKAEAFSSAESRQEAIPALMAAHAPIAGCVYECSDDNVPASPSVFGNVPVVYLHATPRIRGGCVMRLPTDNKAVAKTAFRELSAGRPAAFAVVGCDIAHVWSLERERTFSSLCARSKKPCSVFERTDEPPDARAKRLAAFVATLPRHTAVFAVNDLAAAEVIVAARTAYRHIPRELTLLGVDNLSEVCEAGKPTISSIQIDFERAGFLAARMIGEGAAHATRDTRQAEAVASRTCACRLSHVKPHVACRVSDVARCQMPFSSATVGPLLAVRRESTGGAGRREPFVLEAVERIRREACDGLTADDVIKAAPVSRSLFILRFREAVGHSIQNEIEHVRLERVFTLLRDPEMPIGAIASFCGWRSDIALRWLFRRRTGMSMRQWRQKNT